MNNDLISRSDLIEATADYRCGLHGVRRESVEMIFKYIKHAPAVDAEPVRHGFWIPQDERWTRYMCSICRVTGCGGFEKFCPNCGSKMDAEPPESVT